MTSKEKSVGGEILKGLTDALDAIKNDTPLRTTTYERQKDGTPKRIVAMMRPSELRKPKKKK